MAAEERIPETHYAAVGEDRIAYQVFGDGEVELLCLPTSAQSWSPGPGSTL